MYGYVGNNPINRLDLFGLRPRDYYRDEEAAARAGMADAYDLTHNHIDREYGGNIYLLPDGESYSYTAPQPGLIGTGEMDIKVDCPPDSRTSDYHSHPYGGFPWPSNLVDKNGNPYGDIPYANKTGYAQYDIGFTGDMYRANANTSVDSLGNKDK